MFDTGTLRICEYGITSEGGGMPVEGLSVKSTVFYGMRSSSYTRIYQARGADSTVDLVVRVPEEADIKVGDYCIIGNDIDEAKNTQYRVDIVDAVVVRSSLRAQEATLVRSEELYDVIVNE